MNDQPISFGVITVSDRSARREREDLSGKAARELLAPLGSVIKSIIVADGIEPVQDAIHECVMAGAQIVVTTGGTGITRRDCTPQAVAKILSYEIPGLPEMVRMESKVSTAALTRSLAGVVEIADKRACVICLPGSPGGVVDGLTILQPLFEHIVAQLNDADHAPSIHNHAHSTHDSAPAPASHHAAATVETHESITRKLAKLSDESDSHEAGLSRSSQAATRDSATNGANAQSGCQIVVSRVQNTEILMEELDQAVRSDRAGACLSFAGRVRNHDEGHEVDAIEYVAHPSSPEVLDLIAREVSQRPGICGLAVIHRFGHLDVGEIALGAVISAEHRREAYQAMEMLIDRIKMELPVWKRQDFVHGGSQWSGMA